ncbi:MAG: acyltransferase family protein [Mucilaginibacter sp.]
MINLRSVSLINSPNRIFSVDIFRGIAIIAVVVYHFNRSFLPFGELGVDLFFVISGLLIGGILIKQLKTGQRINFFKFFLERGFKIWPSYYAFLLFANILAYFLYKRIAPGQFIPLWDIKRYVFFYQNYTGIPFHWSFDHIWSLCVEEHFYFILPILFLIIQNLVKDKYRLNVLLTGIVFTIFAGILFKFCSFYLTHSKDTYSGTHNRIDALAWGILLSYIVSFHAERMKRIRVRTFALLTGSVIFFIAVYNSLHPENIFFNKVILHSIVPMAFFLMMLGLYFANLKFTKLQLVAYYSYNWYLWHPVFVIILKKYLGASIIGLVVFMVISITVAIIFTILIEEPILQKRSLLLKKIFTR